MTVNVHIIDGPLQSPGAASRRDGESGREGARVIFEGIVRRDEQGASIAALNYEVYEPMASRLLGSIATELIEAHSLLAMHIEHSRGLVPVGACSFRLIVFAVHRPEALAATEAFISRMKRDVPIWKLPVGPATL